MNTIFKEISKDITNTMKETHNETKTKIIPLEKLNKFKKYEIKTTIKKTKQGYQMLVFFKMKKDKYDLVYATKKDALELAIETRYKYHLFKKPTQYVVSYYKFKNINDKKKLDNWCGKFNRWNYYMETLKNERLLKIEYLND